MKLMKKVLVLALAAATILMVACDNGNGGGGTSGSGTSGSETSGSETSGSGTSGSETSGSGTSGSETSGSETSGSETSGSETSGSETGGSETGGSDGYVSPTLPESKGTDPFAGLETLTTDDPTVRYQVDTTKKVLTEECSEDGTTWSKSAEYSYSYDGTATPPTITRRLDVLAAGTAEFKEGYIHGFEEVFNELSSLDAATKKAKLADLNEAYGLALTEADLAADKKAATLEKVWNSKTVQDMLEEQLKELLSLTPPTYAVTLTEKSGTTAKITVEGQYDSKLAWHEQTAGPFVYMGDDYTVNAFFFIGGGSVQINDVYYGVTDITEKTINCRDRDGTSKSFSYTTTGTGKDTVVTITVEAGKTIECTWSPSATIG